MLPVTWSKHRCQRQRAWIAACISESVSRARWASSLLAVAMVTNAFFVAAMRMTRKWRNSFFATTVQSAKAFSAGTMDGNWEEFKD